MRREAAKEASPIVLQADFELLDGFVRRAKGFDAVPAEIMGGVFHVILGFVKSGKGGVM